MKTLLFVLLSLSLLASAQAQTVTLEYLNPGSFDQAIGISPNGEYVCGGNGSSGGFIWSPAGGLVTGFGFPVDAWGVSNDGESMSGTFSNSGVDEAGIWTSGGGTQLLGNPTGTACGFDLSHLFGMDADGDVAVGMAWESCRTNPVRWTPGTGLTVMAKQSPTDSARANRVSGDGIVAVGWDQGGAGSRRACIWTDPNTQVFPTTTGGNPSGLGEALDVNSDGSVVSGTTLNSAFRWTSGGGLQILDGVPGFGGGYYANGISEDGSIVVGVRLQFPTAEGVLWTPTTGAIRMVDFLEDNGVSVVGSNVRNCTDVSADGKKICGWGNNGPWLVTISDDDPWVDVGGGTVGANGPDTLVGSGTLVAGTTAGLDLTGVPANALTLAWLSFTSVPQNFFGGTIYATPFNNQFLFTANGLGVVSVSTTWPGGLPAGTQAWFQFLAADASVLWGITLSNGLMITTP